MSHNSYQLPHLEHPSIALCMNVVFLQLDVWAAISLLNENASASTVLQAKLPLAVAMMPTPFPTKTIKCFTPALLNLSNAVLKYFEVLLTRGYPLEQEDLVRQRDAAKRRYLQKRTAHSKQRWRAFLSRDL